MFQCNGQWYDIQQSHMGCLRVSSYIRVTPQPTPWMISRKAAACVISAYKVALKFLVVSDAWVVFRMQLSMYSHRPNYIKGCIVSIILDGFRQSCSFGGFCGTNMMNDFNRRRNMGAFNLPRSSGVFGCPVVCWSQRIK